MSQIREKTAWAPSSGPITSMGELLDRARSLPPRVVVIACAQDDVALEAAAMAEEEGLARSILVGDRGSIEALLLEMRRDPTGFQIVDCPLAEEAVATSVGLVREGQGHMLMKGKVTTGELLREVLHRDRGLRTGSLLSDVFLFDSPLPGNPRIMGITDGGINLAPDLEAKARILSNAVGLFHALGYGRPKVAVLSAIETVNPDLPSTLDAAELARMGREGRFGSCEVAGPLAMDLALSRESARRKGVESPVAGEADILLFPSIEAANITAKALQYMVPFEPGHVVVGARVPVLIPSRAESARAKVNAVAVGRLMVDREGPGFAGRGPRDPDPAP
jgi:phosphate butyryltransferase